MQAGPANAWGRSALVTSQGQINGAARYLPILVGLAVWLAMAGLATLLLYYADAKARLEAATGVRAALGEARDEIAEMANSLLVFRDSMIQGRTLSAEQDKDRVAKAERALPGANPEDADELRGLLDDLRSALDRRSEADIRRISAEVEDLVFYLE